MKSSHITIGVIALAALILIGWDIYVALNNVNGDTISAIIYDATPRLAIMPFAWGVLATHFFWPSEVKRINSWLLIACLLVLGGILSGVGILLGPPEGWAIFAFIVGLASGRLWANKGKDGE